MNRKKEISEIEKIISLAYDSVFNDPSRGLSLSRNAYTKAKALNYKKGIAESKLQEGWCLLVKSDFKKSLQAFGISKKIFITLENKEGVAKVYNATGALYRNINDHNTAMDYYIKTLELSLDIHNNNLITASYINIGEIYSELQNFDDALTYFQKAEQLLKETANNEQLSFCQVNIGDIYAKSGKIEEALYCYKEGLKNAKASNNRISECKCLTSMGTIHQKTGDYRSAEDSHFKSLNIAESTGDKLGKTECLINLGNLYLLEGKTDKALDLFRKTLNLSKSINSQYMEMLSHLGISGCYESKDMFAESLLYYKKYHDLNTKLHKEDIGIHLKTMEVQKKVTAAEKEIEELQEAFDRVSLLNKVGQEITSSLELETVMSAIYNNISKFISTDLFGIALYDKKLKKIKFDYYIQEGVRTKESNIPADSKGSMVGWVIRNKKYLLLNDVQKEYKKYVPKLIGDKTETTNSLIFAPILSGDEVIGVITIQSYTRDAYTLKHLELLKAMGTYCAIALGNSRVHREIFELNDIIHKEKQELEKAYSKIDRMANHDILTGLPNRRLFIELLKPALKQADRNKTKTAVLFIDLDDFKPVNDKLGHAAGDRVLQMVAQRFTSSLRESDAIARIGGDEFAAIICNTTNRTDIMTIATKIIEKFKTPFSIDSNKCKIGLSMGISIYPDDDRNIDNLLKKADTAMYKIKMKTKNSFTFYSDLKKTEQ